MLAAASAAWRLGRATEADSLFARGLALVRVGLDDRSAIGAPGQFHMVRNAAGRDYLPRPVGLIPLDDGPAWRWEATHRTPGGASRTIRFEGGPRERQRRTDRGDPFLLAILFHGVPALGFGLLGVGMALALHAASTVSAGLRLPSERVVWQCRSTKARPGRLAAGPRVNSPGPGTS